MSIKKIIAHPSLISKLKNSVCSGGGGLQIISSSIVDKDKIFVYEPDKHKLPLLQELNSHFTSVVRESFRISPTLMGCHTYDPPTIINWFKVIKNKNELCRGFIVRRWFFFKKWHKQEIIRHIRSIDEEWFEAEILSTGKIIQKSYNDCGIEVDDKRDIFVKLQYIGSSGPSVKILWYLYFIVFIAVYLLT